MAYKYRWLNRYAPKIPTTPPMVEKKILVNEKTETPQIVGTSPPSVEPTAAPSHINCFMRYVFFCTKNMIVKTTNNSTTNQPIVVNAIVTPSFFFPLRNMMTG
jgi:hypothetical protein